MKRLIYILSIGFILFSATSCDEMLNPEAITSLVESDVIYSYGNTQATLNAIYTYLPEGLTNINGAMMASASDEAEYTIETNQIQNFNTGSWNPVNNPDDAWKRNFAGIYNVNLFLINCDSVRMEYLRLDPSLTAQQQYQTNLKNMKRWKYEARFLRAFFYFELIKRYGGVPLITKPLGLKDDFKNIQRDSLYKCVNFIVSECDSAANNLPAIYIDDLGRATKGAAMALKSRVLLYAASDLYNDPTWAGGYEHPEFISMTDNKTRLERWNQAAKAAADVINLTEAAYAIDNIGGVNGYKHVFRSYDSPEIILARRYSSTNTFEINNYPIGYYLGNSGNTPSQNLVDDYEMSNGTNFDWNNPLHAVNPYADRDPRLGFTVLTNNAFFKGRPVETYVGGADGKGIPRATRTGYYLAKYLDHDMDLQQGYTSVHHWVLFRLGEMYLNYAEAVNEISGPNGKYGGVSYSARQSISNTIRKRVGMRIITETNKEKFREIVRRERRIEMAFEDQRLWDVRRWMIAQTKLGSPLRGIEITKSDTVYNYKVVEIEQRVFDPKMYFYPIPQKELSIASNWVQNPLW